MNNSNLVFTIFLGLAVWVAPSFAVNAGDYPDRPISVAACYPPGGGVDRNLRMVERVASKYLGPVILAAIQNWRLWYGSDAIYKESACRRLRACYL